MRNKSKIMLSMAIFFLLLFVNSASAISWTGEQCADSGIFNTGFHSTVDIPTNTIQVITDSIPDNNTDIISSGNYIYCTQEYINSTAMTAQNYYCIQPITSLQYQLSSSCQNSTIYNTSKITYITNGYYCIREWNRTTTSRVNLSWINLGGTDRQLIICHLETEDMLESGFSFFPITPILGNDLYIRWDTSIGTNVTDVLITLPDLTYHHTVSFENQAVDLENLQTAGNFQQTGNYYFNITSCQKGNFLNASSWENCYSCTGGFSSAGSTWYNCLTATGYTPPGNYTPPTAPPPLNIDAYIVNISVPTQTVKQNQIIPIGVQITNNGTNATPVTLYVGLSVGTNSTGIFCNRDCYADCVVYGDVSCDYHNVTLHAGQTVIITRQFKFLNTWFNAGQNYDIASSVSTAPYQAPAGTLDYNLTLNYFTVNNVYAPIISNKIIIPTIICRGQNLLFGWNTDINSDTKLEAWYSSQQPYNLQYFESTLNHAVNLSGIFVASTGTLFYDIKSCYNSNNPYLYVCSNYTSSLSIGDCDVNKPLGEQAGDLFAGLGIGQTAGLYLFSLLISLVLSLAVLFWTKQMDFGIFVFLIFMTLFAFIGWLPFWFLILEIVIAGLFIMTKLRGAISGN